MALSQRPVPNSLRLHSPDAGVVVGDCIRLDAESFSTVFANVRAAFDLVLQTESDAGTITNQPGCVGAGQPVILRDQSSTAIYFRPVRAGTVTLIARHQDLLSDAVATLVVQPIDEFDAGFDAGETEPSDAGHTPQDGGTAAREAELQVGCGCSGDPIGLTAFALLAAVVMRRRRTARR